MSDRKAELERKKAKLQAMRDEKKRKEEERRKKEPNASSSRQGSIEGKTENAAMASPASSGDLRTETEQMLKDLGIESPVAGEAGSGGGGGATPARASPAKVPHAEGGGHAPPQQAHVAAPHLVGGHRQGQLTTSKVTQTNIMPKEVVSYCKETQTPFEQVDREDNSTRSNSPAVGNSPRLQSYGSPKLHELEWDDEFSCQEDDDTDSLDVAVDTPPLSAHSHHKMPHVEMARPMELPEDLPPPKEVEAEPEPDDKSKDVTLVSPPQLKVPELSEEDKSQLMLTEDFHRFIDRSTRLVERAIYEEVDIFTDYTGVDREDEEGGLGEGERLKLNRQFFDERWSKHRTVTCIDWSSQHPELLVASYNNNEESPHDPDGVALLWNLKYKKTTPEYVFHCQSAVMSTCFAKFHPNLIVGGTYSGQIVLWDNRSNKRTPVQRTPLSAAAHTHPVYCVNVVGTQNAHNLISVSTDGKMCSWSLDMLSQPQDSMELQHKQSKAVAVTSFSFLSGDVNNFVVGSEEGAVYTACRHGSKAGINDMFEGHQGPVTGIDCQTVLGQIDFSHYFITSSFDWTVKLWNIKENRPLHSFEDNSDYVYDARWSPIHPALFATVDGMGRLDLWNLNNDTEVPTATTIVDSNVALNKCRWHQGGHSIAVGDDLGKIHIYDVGEPLAVPRNDEWSKFVHTLQDLKTNQAEQDEDQASFSSASPLR